LAAHIKKRLCLLCSSPLAVGSGWLSSPACPLNHGCRVRIGAKLPDVEIFVHGVPDAEKLKLVREHAENLKKALLGEGDNDQ